MGGGERSLDHTAMTTKNLLAEVFGKVNIVLATVFHTNIVINRFRV